MMILNRLSHNLIKVYFIIPFLLLASNLKAQQDSEVLEILEWINSKLSNYAAEPILLKCIEINENKELVILDVRGSFDSPKYYTLQKIKILDVYSINLRIEKNFVAIDIIPKSNKTVEVRVFDMDVKYQSIVEMRSYLKEISFSKWPSGEISKAQISLKASSQNQDIGERVIQALKKLFLIFDHVISEEKF